ncbi:MAG: hypothetical protein ABL993_00990 [Vicinamibacterales bacterium]
MTDEQIAEHMGWRDPSLSWENDLAERLRTLVARVKAEERERIARWLATQRNEIPATGAEFAAALRMDYEQT